MGGKVIVVGVVGLLVGFVGGAAATWGLDPADEPEQAGFRSGGLTTIIVFVEHDLSDAEVAAVETEIRDDPRVDELDYLDREESVETYRDVFADDDEMLGRIDEGSDLLPTSFRFLLVAEDAADVEDLLTDLDRIDGVIRAVATVQTQATALPGQPIRWN